MQLEPLEEDGLGLSRLGNAPIADHRSRLCRHYHIDCLDLGNLVEHLARLIPQAGLLAHLAQHLP